MKISVIIPSYKPKDYLWECLDSLYNQTMSKNDFEVILVLNGCKEPHHSEILKYKESHSEMNLIYLQTDYGNASNARNMGLKIFKGDYVTFIDDDDYVSPSYLQELYDNVSPDVVSVAYAIAFNDCDPTTPIPYYISEVFDYCKENNKRTLNTYARRLFNGPVMKLFPKSYVEGNWYDERFVKSQDTVYMFLISKNVKQISFTSKNAIYYRRYRENSVVTKKRSKYEITKLAFDLIRAYTCIYFKGGYSAYFYVSRIAAALKSCFV